VMQRRLQGISASLLHNKLQKGDSKYLLAFLFRNNSSNILFNSSHVD
jgi:hypothetical protein